MKKKKSCVWLDILVKALEKQGIKINIFLFLHKNILKWDQCANTGQGPIDQN